MRFTIFFLFAIIFLSTSCTKEQDITDIEEEPFMPITNVEVKTLAISIGEDIPFTCTINEQEYSSLGGGILLIESILLDRKGNSILIQSDGYYDEIRYVIPRLDANLHLELALSKIIFEGGFGKELEGFNAKEGGTISGYRIDIIIEPNSIVDAAGNIFEGDVRVFASSTFNAAYATTIRRFPQFNYTENDISKTLNICGGLNLVLLDSSDNQLSLKDGATADISFEIVGAAHIVIPDILELRYYDVDNDEWIDMGTAKKEGELLFGTLTNLGIIGWGTSYVSRVAQIKLVTDEGVIIPNKFVLLFTNLETPYSMAYSDNKGIVKIHIPVSLDFRLTTFEISGQAIFASKEYLIVGSGPEDVVLLEDFVLDSEVYQIYNGNVVDCDNNVIIESAIIMSGSSNVFSGEDYGNYFFSDENGEFNFAQIENKNNPIKVEAFDLTSGQTSKEYDVFNYFEKIVDFESLSLCE